MTRNTYWCTHKTLLHSSDDWGNLDDAKKIDQSTNQALIV